MNSSPAPLESPLKNGVEERVREPHFEPIVTLPEVKIPTLEEDEAILIKQRAKLFRLDKRSKEWKERGTGDAKLLHHETNNTVRVVMRRDQTLKLCANHYVTPYMELSPHNDSNRTWIWTTMADYSDGFANSEILAIRFINPENAKKWKEKFDEAKKIVGKNKLYSEPQSKEDDSEEDELSSLDGESDISDYKDAEEGTDSKQLAKEAQENKEKESPQKDSEEEAVAEIIEEVNKLKVKNEEESVTQKVVSS